MSARAEHARGREPLGAFTLVELLVAMGVLPLLLLGLASAVLVARQAVPDGSRGPSATLGAGRALEQLAADLPYATSVLVTAPTEIVFTTEDRNGDASPETVRYFWSGAPGDPLVRQANGAATVAVAAGVQEFRLDYATREEQLPASSSEGAERLLASYNGLLNLGGFLVNSSDWCGQDFAPDLPADATAWRVTRVGFRARSSWTATGEIRVQLRTSAAKLPTMNVLADVSVLESSLADWTYHWVEIPFTAAPQAPPGTRMSLVVKGVSAENSCDIEYQSLLATAATSNFVKTTTAGADWSAPLGQDMAFYVYGVASTPDPPATRKVLDSVQFTLRCGTAASTALRGSARTLNQPAAPGP